MGLQLNPKTKSVVRHLLAGESVNIGTISVDAFSPEARVSLRILLENLPSLQALKGSTLATEFLNLHKNESSGMCVLTEKPIESHGATLTELDDRFRNIKWRIGLVRAHSFRGLAPAGQEWQHDFGGDSHLLHGPNGCGKSSLFGAISWCLTGFLFRDDCEPSSPQSVDVFLDKGGSKLKLQRLDALTLVDEKGESTKATSEFWVALKLVAQTAKGESFSLWVRRHSNAGLQYSEDDNVWSTLPSIETIGISELDAELHVLMPARVNHIQFGKNPDLVKLFAQIVGMGDLEQIAETAGTICSASRRYATKLSNEELRKNQGDSEGNVDKIREAAQVDVRAWAEYNDAIALTRNLEKVEVFGKRLAKLCDSLNAELAESLGLQSPPEGSAEYDSYQRYLKQLPGHVQAAVGFLSLPIAKILPKITEIIPADVEILSALDSNLHELELSISREISERLAWALQERNDSKIGLFLSASKYFDSDANICPLCTQDLSPVPDISDKIKGLTVLLSSPHLKKEIEDHELQLLARLDAKFPVSVRSKCNKSLSDRINEDWGDLVDAHLPGLLKNFAGVFYRQIDAITRGFVEITVDRFVVPPEFEVEFPDAYSRIADEMRLVRQYVALVHSAVEHASELKELADLITNVENPKSLATFLSRGSETNEKLLELEQLRKATQDLYKSQREVEKLERTIEEYRSIADAIEESKKLGDLVREAVIGEVSSMHQAMGSFYSKLYDKEFLPFQLLTAGHAINQDIREEVNAYLKAGSELVPIGPFSNAGRLRALALSFVFALLERSKKSLDVLILDDPALSLDDQHRARLLKYLIAPVSVETQTLLATHYSDFFREAQDEIAGATCLRLTPRRRNEDAVGFEPSDLLARVGKELDKSSTSFLEAAIDLRKWIERVFSTLSAYSPEPFSVPRNLIDTRDRYLQIADPRIATKERHDIVEILSPSLIKQLHQYTAHDGLEPTDTMVRDWYSLLIKCDKFVSKEIERLRELYKKEGKSRSIEGRPSIRLLTHRTLLPAHPLYIVGMAAASDCGAGVEWQENVQVQVNTLGRVVATLDVLFPVISFGQEVLVDCSDRVPESSDLVVVQCAEGARYLRRLWKREDSAIILEAINPLSLYEPEILSPGQHEVGRIVGVWFASSPCRRGEPGKEWITSQGDRSLGLSGIRGVRVHGTSMEPVARDGQLILISEEADLRLLGKGEVACVDLEEHGTVVKRCFLEGDRWFLTSVNQAEVYPPIVVTKEEMRRGKVYIVKGVLFEWDSN